MYRINDELIGENSLSPKQFGFRPGRSTADAIKEILQIRYITKRLSNSRRKAWCAIIALYVKNEFNAVPWSEVIKGLKAKNIFRYLTNFIQSYFEGRKICFDNRELDIRAAVPQGSSSVMTY